MFYRNDTTLKLLFFTNSDVEIPAKIAHITSPDVNNTFPAAVSQDPDQMRQVQTKNTTGYLTEGKTCFMLFYMEKIIDMFSKHLRGNPKPQVLPYQTKTGPGLGNVFDIIFFFWSVYK